MYYTIYKITNIINNKIYIGVHKTNNLFDGYYGSGKYLKRAINKHGIENFKKEIMQLFYSSEQMYDMERLTISENFVNRKNTYNLKTGGEGGFDYLNKTGKNLYGMNGKGKYGSQNLLNGKEVKELLIKNGAYKNWCKNVSKGLKKKFKEIPSWWIGKKHTKETKIKISKVKMGTGTQKGKLNSQYGTCWIYNLELKENKKIPKINLQEWLDINWIKGRKMKFNKNSS